MSRARADSLALSLALLAWLACLIAWPVTAGEIQSRPCLTPARLSPPAIPGRRPALGKGIFLVANHHLNDPNFAQTVVLITDYSDTGAAGLVINRRLNLQFEDLLPDKPQLLQFVHGIYLGGPVAINRLRLLIRSETAPAGAVPVFANVHMVDTPAALAGLSDQNLGPGSINLYAGSAGWAAGQLEGELLRGDWYLWHADVESVYASEPETVWPDLIRMLSGQWAETFPQTDPPECPPQRYPLISAGFPKRESRHKPDAPY